MAADGYIEIDTKIDAETAQKDLDKLNNKIKALNDKIASKQKAKLPLVEEAQRLGVELDNAKAKLDEMQNGGNFYTTQSLKEQENVVKNLQSEWDRVNNKIDKYDGNIAEAEATLASTQGQAGELERQIAGAAENSSALGEAMDIAEKKANKLLTRIKGLARRVFVFTVITMGLRAVRDWFGNVIKTNDEAVSAIARLKGAFLTLAQPLVDVIVPALISFINVLTKVVTALAQVMASLFGTTVSTAAAAASALNDETNAINGTSKAAKKASKSLASFDEVNQLTSNTASDASGTSGINADFSGIGEMDNAELMKTLGIVGAIGAAFLGWKLAPLFQSQLGGTVLAITLIAGGLALLVSGFADAYAEGWNFQNLIQSIAGILSIGIGIAILAGSWIPLLIAGIASLLLAMTVATGHGEELLDGLKQAAQGFIDFFKGIFTGDLELTISGIGDIFDGLSAVFSAIFDGIRDTVLSFLDWLDEKTGGRFHDIIEIMKEQVKNGWDFIKNLFSTILSTIKEVLTGVTQFISGVFSNNWDLAWKGVCNIFIALINGVIGAFESLLKFIVGGINNLLLTASKAVNEIGKVFGANWSISARLTAPTFKRIPLLAQGAVIPPNREFLAVLGDQTSGTNIETPLATMVEAFKQALGESGGGTQTITLYLDGDVIAKNTVKRMNSMTVKNGKTILR